MSSSFRAIVPQVDNDYDNKERGAWGVDMQFDNWIGHRPIQMYYTYRMMMAVEGNKGDEAFV